MLYDDSLLKHIQIFCQFIWVMIYFIQGEGGISHHFEEPFGFQKSQDRGKKYTFCNYGLKMLKMIGHSKCFEFQN